MRKIDRDHNFDFKNKTYVCSIKNWGVRVLKHFTLCDKHNRQLFRWRFITMDGTSISNILITVPLDECAFMHETPEDAIEHELKFGEIPASGGGTLYEVDDMRDIFSP